MFRLMDWLQILLMDTHGSWSAVGHTYYLQLIWQGPVCVGLQDMDLDLSESDFSLTTCNEIGFGYYGQLRTVEDCAGSVIQYGWIITTSHIKHYTGKSQVSRGDPVGQGQTGEAWSRKTCEEWDLPGKRRRWQLSTDKNGVGVWPIMFTWTWDESSQVKSRRRQQEVVPVMQLKHMWTIIHLLFTKNW